MIIYFSMDHVEDSFDVRPKLAAICAATLFRRGPTLGGPQMFSPHSNRTELPRDFLPSPIPNLSPLFRLQISHNVDQFLRCVFWLEQLPFARGSPEILAQVRLHSTWMNANAHGLTLVHLKLQIEGFDHLIERCLGRTIRIPPAAPIITDGAYTSRYMHPFCGSLEVLFRMGGWQEARKVFDEEEMG